MWVSFGLKKYGLNYEMIRCQIEKIYEEIKAGTKTATPAQQACITKYEACKTRKQAGGTRKNVNRNTRR